MPSEEEIASGLEPSDAARTAAGQKVKAICQELQGLGISRVPIAYDGYGDSGTIEKIQAPDVRHRALRHHAEGIFLAEKLFGPVIPIATGGNVPTRFIGEQHVKEDLGWIPTVQDWLSRLTVQPWMLRVDAKPPGTPPPLS